MTSDLEKYRQQAMELWFNNGGSCTGVEPPEPKEIDDAIAEDFEFRRIQNENEWRETQLKKVRNLQPTKPI